MIIENQKVLVLKKSADPYTVNGQSGISRKVNILVNMQDVFTVKFNEASIEVFNELPNKGEATVDLEIEETKTQGVVMKIVKNYKK